MKKLRVLKVFLFLFSFGVSISLTYASESKAYFKNATKAQRKGKLYQAIFSYEKVLHKDPTNLQAHLNLATLLYEVKEHKKAYTLMDELLELNPFFLEGNYNLGLMYLKEGRFKKAQHFIEIAVKLREDDYDSRHQLARIYSQVESFALAEKEYLKLISMRPNEISIRLEHSQFLVKNKKNKLAEKEFWKLLDLDKKDFHINYEYALFLDALNNRVENAITQYNNVLLLNGNHLQARYNLAQNYEKMKIWDLAKKQYTSIILNDPTFFQANLRLGVLARREGKDKLAFKHFNRVVKERPRTILPYEERALIYIKQKKFDKAAEEYLFLSRIYPKYVKAYVFKGWLFEQLGQIEKSKNEYLHALKLDSNHNLAKYKVGSIYFEKGNKKLASKYLNDIDKKSKFYNSGKTLLDSINGKRRIPGSEK